MNTKIIAFFNNKGRVGKTSLVYHLAWMYNELNFRVVVADLDPQANLTAAFLNEDRLEELWLDGNRPKTIFGCVQPLIKGIGDIAEPHLEYVEDFLSNENLALLVGDLSLSGFEDQLSEVWPKCMDGDERAFRVISAFWRVMQKTAVVHQADLILVDLGPNLGAINRAALIAADYVVMPLSPDLFSLQGLQNLGPTLRRWRQNWKDRLHHNPADDLVLPQGQIQPIGYVVLQHSARLDRPVKAYNHWIARIPHVYREAVLAEPVDNHLSVADDPHCLALVKNYQSLMPMAQEARKPIFYLKPADGALGAHATAAKKVYRDFQRLADKIAERTSAIQLK
ncbi:MAG: AAA family ATPase [Symploca sp. SIO3E6]|nr:AAA family ATPase [Caldora sp. SIO3E6]